MSTAAFSGQVVSPTIAAEFTSYSGPVEIDVMSSPVFGGLEDFYQTQALEAASLLNRVVQLGYDVSRAKRIIDFGSSAGGPTLALVKMAELNGGTVDALERNNYQVQTMISSGILPADRAHAGDGLKFLGGMAARGEHCDLITAFMLGPDAHGGLTEGLTEGLTAAAGRVLEPLGHLLITSDSETMATVRQVCDRKRLRYDYLVGVSTIAGLTPDTLIATFPSVHY